MTGGRTLVSGRSVTGGVTETMNRLFSSVSGLENIDNNLVGLSLKCDYVGKVLHTAPGTMILILATAFRDQKSFQVFCLFVCFPHSMWNIATRPRLK